MTSVCDAWNSASAWMILARRSRSASACLAMARTMFVGQLDRADLDVADLDAPGLRLCVDDRPGCRRAQLLALGQHLVEFVLPEHGAERRLREHVRRRAGIVLDLDDRTLGIDDVDSIERRRPSSRRCRGRSRPGSEFRSPGCAGRRAPSPATNGRRTNKTGASSRSGTRPSVKTTARSYCRRIFTQAPSIAKAIIRAKKPMTMTGRTLMTDGTGMMWLFLGNLPH